MENFLMESRFLTEFLIPINFLIGGITAIWFFKRYARNGMALRWMLLLKAIVIGYITIGYGLYLIDVWSGPMFREVCTRPGFFAMIMLFMSDCIIAGDGHGSV